MTCDVRTLLAARPDHTPAGSHDPVDPLTEDDYQALQASVDADARRLLPAAFAYIASQVGL